MDIFQRIEELGEGHHDVYYQGQRWGLSIKHYSNGHAVKVYAELWGDNDFISGNFYLIDDVWSLKPCEMPIEKVVAFLEAFTPKR